MTEDVKTFPSSTSQDFPLNQNGKKEDYFCLFLLQPTCGFFLSSSPPSSEAVWLVAITADGDNCYSTGGASGQQGQPDDLKNL